MAIEFSDLTRVRDLMGFAGGDTDSDAAISLLLTQYSEEFERILDRHTLVATRTEVRRQKPGKRTLSLRAAPLTAVPTTIKYEASRDFTNTTAMTIDRDYVVDLEQGLITFMFGPTLRHGYVETVYNAGMAANTAGMITAYPALSNALDMQVAYHMRRRDFPGGDRTVQGGSTSFVGELELLDTVKRVLAEYRRHYW